LYFAASYLNSAVNNHYTMARTTIEKQEELREQFLMKLTESENSVLMRVQLYIRGDVKKKFIEDLRKGDKSINKLSNTIFKFYYDNKK
jgi:hypothetical protein